MKTLAMMPRRSKRYSFAESWSDVVCKVVARFVRGNISAQSGRILFPADQEVEREKAVKIARRWRDRKATS